MLSALTCPNRLKTQLFCVLALLLATGTAHAQTPMTFDKAFSPDTIGPGSVATLQFDITNLTSTPADTVAFTDVLPGGVTIADPAASTNTCGGTVSAPDGGSTITFSDGEIAASSACTITVDITSSVVGEGPYTNETGVLTSSIGSGGTATADLTVTDNLPGFSKSFAPSSVPLGGRSTLTFLIDNSANGSSVDNLDFTDVLPSGMEIASPAVASTTCGTATIPPTLTAVTGTNAIILDANGIGAFPALAAGATCTTTVDVVTTGSGELDNISGELLADFVSSGKASATLEVTVTPISLSKSFTDDPVPPGGMVTLDFKIDNFDRLDSATGIAFTDDLTTALAGLTFASLLANDCGGSVSGVGTTTITFSGGTLAPEADCTISTSLSVPVGAVPGAYTNTTGAITATVGGAPVTGNAASEDLFVEPIPILTKEFLTNDSPPTPDPIINAGDDVILRFTVTNTSTTSAATDVAFIDELTDGSSAIPPNPTSGFLPFPVTVALPSTPDPPCGAGSSLALVSLGTDRQGLSLTGGSLAAAGMSGDSCTFEVVLSIPSGMAPGTYLNTTEDVFAVVDGALRTGAPGSDDLTITGAPRLTKSFTDDPVAPGDTVTLEFTLTHSADALGDATDITFTDDLAPVLTGLTANLPSSPDPPCGAGSTLTGSAADTLLTFQGGTLAPGANCTFSVTLDVPIDANPGNHTNTTSGVGATVSGMATTSGPAADDLQIAGLTFSKEFIGDPVIPGENVTLRFTIENTSPTDDASGIFFTDNLNDVLPGTPDLSLAGPLPATPCGPGSSITGTSFLIFTGGELAQGDPPCTFDISLLVPAGAPNGSFINTTSSLTATIGGSSVSVNPASDHLVVNSNLLFLTKEFTDDPVVPGGTVNLRFTVTNSDDVQATAIAFTDDLGATLAGLTATGLPFAACGGTVDAIPDAGTIDFSGGVLAAGGTCVFDVSLSVPASAAASLYPNTTSEVTGTVGGLPISGDAANDDLVVIDLLQFSKSFDGPSTATGTPVLTFTITNPGGNSASGLSFSDDLDSVIPGLVATNLPLSDICGAGSSLTGTSFLTLTGGTLPPDGGTCSFDVELLVPGGTTPGTYPNTTSNLFDSGLPVALPATADLAIEPPPTFAKVFSPGTIGLGLDSVLTLTIDNSASAVEASNLDFTDNLPAGVTVATSPNPAVTCTGGTLTATGGSGVISYSGGSIAGGASCTVQVSVSGVAPGTHINLTNDLTSSSGNSGSATDTLTVVAPPGFAKVFAPNPIAVDGISTLTFTIDNSASTSAVTALDFTDALPASVTVATPANASTTCTGGTLTATSTSAVISYTGGTVAAGAICTVQADVTSSTSGSHVNVSGNLTSSLGVSGTATATLNVNGIPGFAKVFAPNPVAVGGTTTLTFTIDNSANPSDAISLDFVDAFPADLIVATPANASTTCTGGTLTATPGAGVVSYTGGTVAGGAVCTVLVGVTSNTAGSQTNISGDLTSSLGNSGTANDTLNVNAAPLFTKVFAPNPVTVDAVTTLTFTIDNTANPTEASALDFTDALPAAITVATPANASTTCVGGTLTAASATGVISYTGGTVAAGASCTVQADVTSNAAGAHVNLSGDLTSSLGNSGPATDTLTVDALPGFSKVFTPSPINQGGISTLTFTIDNTGSSTDATALDFTDGLPADVVVAAPANASSTCTGGTLTAAAGTGVISYTGGTVSAGASCTVQADVTSNTPGTHVNTTGDLTSSLGNSGPATADLEVINVDFTLTKIFTVNPVLRGGVMELEFTLNNPASSLDLTEIAFTDDLDAALSGLVAVGLPVNDICGTGSLLDGSSMLSLSGGSLAAGASCTFSVTLTVPPDAVLGTYTNTTSSVTAQAPGGPLNAAPAVADFDVIFLPFDKTFVSDGAPGDTVVLTFSLSNPDPFNTADDISFTDDLDAVLPGLVAIGLPMYDICGPGSQLDGTSTISLTGGVLGPLEACTFDVSLRIPVAAANGEYLNTTSTLVATVDGNAVTGDSDAAASDTLFVVAQVAIPALSTFGIFLMIGLIGLLSYRKLFNG